MVGEIRDLETADLPTVYDLGEVNSSGESCVECFFAGRGWSDV
jgi:hypothetical protein